MGIFSKKQEVNLESFCCNVYDKYILNPNADANAIYYDKLNDSVVKADQHFANIDSQKFNTEIIIMCFELFSLAWAHQFGDKLAIIQNSFTKKYLHERKRDDIWEAMAHYNKAVSHSATVDVTQAEQANIIKMRADLCDKYIEEAEKNGTDIKDERIGLPLNRLFSEKSWKQGKTSYFLILVLCRRLGLGSGPNYLGPNKEAQYQLGEVIHEFYDGVLEPLKRIKIES